MTLFDTHGYFGKYNKLIVVGGTTDTWYATGSGANGQLATFGQDAIMVSGSVSGSATLSKGGTIDLGVLTSGQVYHLGVMSMVVPTGSVYALYPNLNRTGA